MTHLQALAAIPLIGVFSLWLIGEARENVAKLERKVEVNRDESINAIQLVREENKETRTDIRALSREIRTGQPSMRLAVEPPELKPITTTADGGP